MKSEFKQWKQNQCAKNKMLTYAETQTQTSPRGVVTNVLDRDTVVSEFELQSRYYVHFQKNSLGKDTDPQLCIK